MTRFIRISTTLIVSLACLLLSAAVFPAAAAQTGELYGDFNPGRPPAPGTQWVQSIIIKSPQLRAEIKGATKIEFQARGMRAVRALCWQQPTAKNPDPFGHDVNLAPDLKLDAEGNASFDFPADEFPSGPITLRILAKIDTAKKQDVRELQLYNTGGVSWNQGIPKTDPPAAKRMKLAFSDDFDAALSISNNGKGKRYMAHKPGGGDFSGFPFTGPESPKNSFSQQGTYLRIHASKDLKDPRDKGSTGIISPVDSDGKGSFVRAPFYMECRFIAQSAPGTWPAFWALSDPEDKNNRKAAVDEPDIIEAYGGVGKGNPNGYGLYEVTTHFWNQKGADGKPLKFAVPKPEVWKAGEAATGRLPKAAVIKSERLA